MLAADSAPAIPLWIVAEKEAAMQVDDYILNCTVFLGCPTTHGFSAEGTGFLLHLPVDDMGFLYIVTCRHVVRPTQSLRDETPNNDDIWIRINRSGGKHPKLIKTPRSKWVYHTNRRVDVCLYPFDSVEHDADGDLDLVTLNAGEDEHLVFTEKEQKRWGLALGDEVFIVGCFVGRVGDRKNIPVIRAGSIAAKPDEPIAGVSHQNPAYLIETRSLGGTSGSPVFLHIEPAKRFAGSALLPHPSGVGTVAPYCLIGMMQGYHSGQYASDFLSDEDGAEKVVPVDTDFNAGIGVAIPVSQIMDLLNRLDLKEARMKTIEAKRRQTGLHDASAAVSKPDDQGSDANPDHLEDFKRLVDVAARKRPQGDQT
jgi:Trypsin-like peptidase domain